MNPTPITTLSLTYKGEQKQITAEQFRGAVLDYMLKNFSKKQRETLPMRFASNKDAEGNKTTGYSQIQYNTNKNNLEILAIGEAEKVVEAWMQSVLKNDDFTINGKPAGLENPKKQTQYWYPKLGKHQLYKIRAWVPFGKDNVGKETKFDGIIWGNIQRLLTDLKIAFIDKKTNKPEKVHVHIHEYQRREKTTKSYNVNWITYDVIFSTNINLPQQIGLGRVISLGAGKIKKISLMK